MSGIRSLVTMILCLIVAGCASQSKNEDGASGLPANSNAPRFTPEELRQLSPEQLQDYQVTYQSDKGWAVTHTLFGYLDRSVNPPQFVITDRIPLQPGLIYGWGAKTEIPPVVKPDGNLIRITEVFQLPEAPRRFRVNFDKTQLSETGDRATTQLEFKPAPWLFNFWEITPDDPAGAHRITLKEGEKIIREFQFQVTN